MRRYCPTDLQSNFYRLMNDEIHRKNFYRHMSPYNNLSDTQLMEHIGSFCSKVPAEEKERHLNSLAYLSHDRFCQAKRTRRQIANITYTIKNDPPYFYPRPYAYYNRRSRAFGGFLSALILLGLLRTIF